VRLNEVPGARQILVRLADPVFRNYMDEFARGINDYAQAHPDSIGAEYRVVLPVSGVDVIGHSLRAVHYMYMGSMERMRREVNAALRSQQEARTILPEIPEITPGFEHLGSGPPRSSSGKAMLIINPHLAWGDTFLSLHGGASGRTRIRPLWSAANRFPTPVVRFQPPHRLGPHGQHHRHCRLLPA